MPHTSRVARVALITTALVALLAALPAAYVFTGARWSTRTVDYYINPANADVSAAAAEAAIQAGAATWGSQSNADFRFYYIGRTTGAAAMNNRKNEVFFRNVSSGSTIATTYWWSDSRGNLIDADIMFYDGGFRFFTGSGGCSAGMYIEDIAAHEFGHALGLDHSADASATMYASVAYCSLNPRTLSNDDLAGVEALYPPGSTPTNVAPTVALTAPADGTTVAAPATVTVTAAASDADGSVNHVDFVVNGVVAASDTSAPYSATLTNLAAGSYTLSAVATDNSGATATAAARLLTVTPAPVGASPDGTIVPASAAQIVDSQGSIWTIGGGQAILRNGASAAGGAGSKILWSGGVIYVLGTDSNWYRWTGSGWIGIGTTQPGTAPPPAGTSPDGTLVPASAAQIVDSQGAVWTIGGGQAILRNGARAAGGAGSKILWSGGVVYVLGTDSNWYRWTGSGWIGIGPTQPGAGLPAGTSPDGTVVPASAAQIVDSQGAVWTIGSAQAILRNGASAAGGAGSKILWSSGIIYVFGTDANWYRWTGTGWV